jgi:hypothetical protein
MPNTRRSMEAVGGRAKEPRRQNQLRTHRMILSGYHHAMAVYQATASPNHMGLSIKCRRSAVMCAGA